MNHQDILVEVDWMGPEGIWPWQCQGHLLQSSAIKKMMRIFAGYNFELQIRTENELSHDEYLSQAEWETTYSNHFDADRGVHRYCIMAHKSGIDGSDRGRGYQPGNTFILFDHMIYWDAFWGEGDYWERQVQVFMHELGHNCDLNENTCGCAMDGKEYYQGSIPPLRMHYCSSCLAQLHTEIKFVKTW